MTDGGDEHPRLGWHLAPIAVEWRGNRPTVDTANPL
jgi:hypothetical protein